jgi:hypothetical protein
VLAYCDNEENMDIGMTHQVLYSYESLLCSIVMEWYILWPAPSKNIGPPKIVAKFIIRNQMQLLKAWKNGDPNLTVQNIQYRLSQITRTWNSK